MTAAVPAQPAPVSLRAALEAALADWRDDAVYRPADTRDEITEHHAVTGCADTLAGILADHPDAEVQPADVSPHLGCAVCASGVTVPHGAGGTPGQALSPDPADFAYHVRATAFNVLTGKMAGDEWHVPRSERDAIARAVVDAVEPLIRADERAVAAQEPHAAPGVTEAQLAEALDGMGVDINDGGFLAAGIIDRPREVARALRIRLENASEPQPAPELDGQLRLARGDRDQLRKQVLDLAADLDVSAMATRPSRKSTIEDELAIALRKLLEPVMACDKCGSPVAGGTRCDGCRQLLADLEDK